MKKKAVLLSLLVGLTAMLGGCGFIPELPELSEEQEAMITEYSAGLLIKYTGAKSTGLMTKDELAAEEAFEERQRERDEVSKQLAQEYLAKKAAAKKEEKSKDKKDSDKNGDISDKQPSVQTVDNITGFLGIEGFDVSCSDYIMSDYYPLDSSAAFLSVDADEGKELCIVKLDVTNTSGGASELNMMGSGASYTLNINDDITVRNEQTLLFDDFAAYKETVEAGGNVQSVLLFQIPKGTDINSMQLEISSGNGKGIVNIK